ncbi:MAG: MBOAT family protein [Planctomycetes bacterium]|nr:MBOAT family protein [Planctomycetota bacterium]
MVFASGVFLYFFLPIFLAAYFLTPRKWKSFTIAVASYVFYGWWRPDFVLLMWVSTVVDYVCGQRIERGREHGLRGKRWVGLSLAVNLGLLGYFKYFNFGVDTLNYVLEPYGWVPMDVARVVLPVGISFYTFQTLSYTVDVYRGSAKPVRSFADFMCYVAMFPQLVAGPIVRYNTIADQLHERKHSVDMFYRGVLCFQSGLAKKVLLADVLGGLVAQAFDGRVLGVGDSWFASVAYTFQLYFDFSGYSDMAIGLGLMMGFRLPVNFDRPLISKSITELWRRWHISLSSFLRDYLYIPLGGNKRGPTRTYVNLWLTMVIGGLWHGAAWTYVVWGVWHGSLLELERLAGKRPLYSRAPAFVQTALTLCLITLGFTCFRAQDLSHAGRLVGSMFGVVDGVAAGITVRPVHLLTMGIAAIVVYGFPTTQSLVQRARLAWVIPLQLLFLLALIHLHHEDQVPFLYFQF